MLTVQALAESFHATTRKSLLEPARTSGFVRGWRDVFHVASANDTALVDAMDAVGEHRLWFRNAMLWATARQVGCSAIISEDMRDGRRLSGVEFIDPFSADATSRLAALLET